MKQTTQKGLKEGVVYLAYTKDKNQIFTYLNDPAFKTKLLITRTNPEIIKRDRNLSGVDIVWLTNLSKNDKEISPTDLKAIQKFIIDKLNDGSKSIIIFESFNFVTEFNEFVEVLHFIQNIRDMLSTTEDTMIIPISEDCFTKQQLALLVDECEEI